MNSFFFFLRKKKNNNNNKKKKKKKKKKKERKDCRKVMRCVLYMLFILCLNPIAWKVRATEGYRLSKPISTKITHLLYIEDIKPCLLLLRTR